MIAALPSRAIAGNHDDCRSPRHSRSSNAAADDLMTSGDCDCARSGARGTVRRMGSQALRRSSVTSAAVLLAGGAVVIALGLTRRNIEETVAALGAAYV
ncbi:MAG: hypothetical protein ACREQ5_17365, partial [Candidatus Dormibacteria bacterium]